MAGGEVNRDVVINLRLAGDEANASVAKRETALVQSVAKAESAAAAASIKAEQKAAAAVIKSTDKREQAQLKALERVAKEEEKSRREKEKRQTAETKAAEKVTRNRIKLIARIAKEDEKKRKDSEKLQAAEVKATEKAELAKQKAAEKVTRNRIKMIDRIAKENEKAVKAEIQAAEKQVAKLESLNEKRQGLAKSSQAAGRAALQGVLDVTEGLAFLGIASEDSLSKFAIQFIKIQKGFQILRGGLDIFFEGREALKLYRDATIAAAAANELLAASNTKVAATAVISQAAQSASTSGVKNVATGAAANVVGGAATGAAAKTIAATGFLAGLKVLAAKLTAMAGAVASTVATAAAWAVGFTAAAALVVEAVGQVGKSLGFFDEALSDIIPSWFKATKDRDESIKKTNKMEETRVAKLAALAKKEERTAKQSTFDAGQRTEKRDVIKQRIELEGGDELTQVNKQRKADLAELAAAQAQMAQSESDAAERKRTQQFASHEQEKAALERLQTAQKNILESEKRKLDVLRNQSQARQDAVKSAESELAAARDLIKSEKERLGSKLAAFGALDPRKQAAVKKISEKVASGEKINERESKLLKETGFGKNITDKRDREKGAAAGGAGVLDALGETETLKSAQDNAVIAAQKREIAEAKAADAQAELSKQSGKAAQALERIAEVGNKLTGLNAEKQGVEVDKKNSVEPKAVVPVTNTQVANPTEITSLLPGIGQPESIDTVQNIDSVTPTPDQPVQVVQQPPIQAGQPSPGQDVQETVAKAVEAFQKNNDETVQALTDLFNEITERDENFVQKLEEFKDQLHLSQV